MSTFTYDWFTGPAFDTQKQQARERCARKKFPKLTPAEAANHRAYQAFLGDLEVRTLIYLRDGFSYEMKQMVDIGIHSGLFSFECEPVDEHYKVGAFVVTIPYEEINRVEVFAVHPSQKPEDTPIITGFRTSPSDTVMPREEPRESRDEARGVSTPA